MTSNPHIEIIEKAVYAANHQLKELTLWCKVKFDEDKEWIYIGSLCNLHKIYWNNNLVYEEDIEILGHPIHLEHILRALGERLDWICTYSKDEKMYFFKPLGASVDEWHSGDFGFDPFSIWYDLKLSLSDQPPSTLEWLANIF